MEWSEIFVLFLQKTKEMKKIFIIVATLFIGFNANAQLSEDGRIFKLGEYEFYRADSLTYAVSYDFPTDSYSEAKYISDFINTNSSKIEEKYGVHIDRLTARDLSLIKWRSGLRIYVYTKAAWEKKLADEQMQKEWDRRKELERIKREKSLENLFD